MPKKKKKPNKAKKKEIKEENEMGLMDDIFPKKPTIPPMPVPKPSTSTVKVGEDKKDSDNDERQEIPIFTYHNEADYITILLLRDILAEMKKSNEINTKILDFYNKYR